MSFFYQFCPYDIQGEPYAFSALKEKVVLIVNVASYCAFTPQYHELEALYQKYASKGLIILAFPCNQFGQQEPDNPERIQAFCQSHFEISFPLMSKIDVNGKNASDLYQWLKKEKKVFLGKRIYWNFTKFLINRQGQVVGRYAPWTKPQRLEKIIEKLLK